MFGGLKGLIAVCFCFSIAVVHALSADELGVSQALIVYDASLYDLKSLKGVKPEIKSLIEQMERDGFELTFDTWDNENLTLFVADEARFNHLILLPSSTRSISAAKENFDLKLLLQFLDQNGNVLVVSDPENFMPDEIRTFVGEVGIYPAPKGYKYVDHFNTNKKNTPQISDENVVKQQVLQNLPSGASSYDGTAALLSNNRLLFPLVRSSKTGFTTSEFDQTITEEKLWTAGEQGYLAAGFQALNNARLVWLGSDSLIDEEIVKWTFQEKNVLKLQFVQHYPSNHPEQINGSLYRIKDDVIYTIGVSEFKNDKWAPFTPEDGESLQLDFKMLDPYQRLNLKPLGVSSSEDGQDEFFVYMVNFTLPDQHGIFTFDFDYKRYGYSYLEDKKVVSVRHLANDEYKRSWDISNSSLYVMSAISVIIAWFLFVFNFLYLGNTNVTKKNI